MAHDFQLKAHVSAVLCVAVGVAVYVNVGASVAIADSERGARAQAKFASSSARRGARVRLSRASRVNPRVPVCLGGYLAEDAGQDYLTDDFLIWSIDNPWARERARALCIEGARPYYLGLTPGNALPASAWGNGYAFGRSH